MKEMNITLKPEIDFSDAKVGDSVFCVSNGVGKIININRGSGYPVVVTFGGDNRHTATINGKWSTYHKYASLYYFNPETQEVLYSRPEPKIDWVEYEGKMIEVRDTDNQKWFRRILWKHAPEFKYSFLCYSADDSTLRPDTWKQARLIKEDS